MVNYDGIEAEPAEIKIPEKICAICGKKILLEAGHIVTVTTVGDTEGPGVQAKSEWHCFECDPIRPIDIVATEKTYGP